MSRTFVSRLSRLIVVSVLLAVPASAINAQSRRPIEVDDLFRLQSVGTPVLSPDGAWVAYSVSTTSLEEESSETRIWMVSTEGGDALPMTAAGYSASSPRFSPDNRYLSFQASRNEGKTQVWLLDRRGGEARQLTEVELSWIKESAQNYLRYAQTYRADRQETTL